MTSAFLSAMDLIGIIAFAVSGALVAIDRGLDLFGVMILALTTASGGGFIRDLTIGHTPPALFRNPAYVVLSFAIAAVVFAIVRHVHFRRPHKKLKELYEQVLFITDTLGLAAFTVDGAVTGLDVSHTSAFLIIFLGAVTGVGGGLLRDLFAMKKPYIFVRHIYALAAVAGAAAVAFLPRFTGENPAMAAGFAAVLLIRFLAAHFHWNLPRIQQDRARS